jgi:hypothetical protein
MNRRLTTITSMLVLAAALWGANLALFVAINARLP